MKTLTTGAMSGCVVWLLTFAVVSMCLCPLAMIVGGITSAISSTFVAGVVGPMMCPAGTTPKIITYETTSTDDNGNPQPATGYEMHCLDAGGAVVKNLVPIFFTA